MTSGRVFVSTTFVADDTPIGDALVLLAEHGIHTVELGSNHAFEPDPLGVVARSAPRQHLVHNYFPAPADPFVVNLASLNDEIRERSLAHVERSLEFCRQSGALLYTVHPGFLSDPRGASRGTGNYDFLFREGRVDPELYERAFERMVSALARATDRAAACGVRLAIETEGSVSKRDHLLLQRPEEYERLMRHFSPQAIGVSLNIGHMRLASAAFGFETGAFVDLVADYIVAMELSHNDGVADDHRPLRAGAWYWPVIADIRFAGAYKILEFRNTSMADILTSVAMVDAAAPALSVD